LDDQKVDGKTYSPEVGNRPIAYIFEEEEEEEEEGEGGGGGGGGEESMFLALGKEHPVSIFKKVS
jgi:hypothetical protein